MVGSQKFRKSEISLDTGIGYPNEINSDHRKNLEWINSFMKNKYTISK